MVGALFQLHRVSLIFHRNNPSLLLRFQCLVRKIMFIASYSYKQKDNGRLPSFLLSKLVLLTNLYYIRITVK